MENLKKIFSLVLVLSPVLSILILGIETKPVHGSFISKSEIYNLRIGSDGKTILGGWIVLTLVLDQGEESFFVTTAGSIPIEKRQYPELLKDIAQLRIADLRITFNRGEPFLVGKMWKSAIIQQTCPEGGDAPLRYYPFWAVGLDKRWEGLFAPYKVRIENNQTGALITEKIIVSGLPSDDSVDFGQGIQMRNIGQITSAFVTPNTGQAFIVLPTREGDKIIFTTFDIVNANKNYKTDAWELKGTKWYFTKPFRVHVGGRSGDKEDLDTVYVENETSSQTWGTWAGESGQMIVDYCSVWDMETRGKPFPANFYKFLLYDYGSLGEDDDGKIIIKTYWGTDITGNRLAFEVPAYGNDGKGAGTEQGWWYQGARPNWDVTVGYTVVQSGNPYGWDPSPIKIGRVEHPNWSGKFYMKDNTLMFFDIVNAITGGGEYHNYQTGGGIVPFTVVSEGNAYLKNVFVKQTGLASITDLGYGDRIIWDTRLNNLPDISKQGWEKLKSAYSWTLFKESEMTAPSELPVTANTEWSGYSKGEVGYRLTDYVILYRTQADIGKPNPVITIWLDATKYAEVVYAGGLGKPQVWDNTDIEVWGGKASVGYVKVKNIGAGGDSFTAVVESIQAPSGVSISCTAGSIDLLKDQEGWLRLNFSATVPREADGQRWSGKIKVVALGTGEYAYANIGGVVRYWQYTPVQEAFVTVVVRLIKDEGVFYADSYQVTISGQTQVGYGSIGCTFVLMLEQSSQKFDIYVQVLSPSGLSPRMESRTIVAGSQTVYIDYDLRTKVPSPIPTTMLLAIVGGTMAVGGIGGTAYYVSKKREVVW